MLKPGSNIRVVTSSGRLDEIKYMREVQVLNTIYLELIKNLELVNDLLEETPIIQVVDAPIFYFSLKDQHFFGCCFGFLGFFITSFIILRKLVVDFHNRKIINSQ